MWCEKQFCQTTHIRLQNESIKDYVHTENVGNLIHQAHAMGDSENIDDEPNILCFTKFIILESHHI